MKHRVGNHVILPYHRDNENNGNVGGLHYVSSLFPSF